MMRYYFYFHLAHYPVALITKIGDNRQDQARLEMIESLTSTQSKQSFMFEPCSEDFDKWQEYDERVRNQKRFVNFIDLWRFHFSPLHANSWDWLLCRSVKI